MGFFDDAFTSVTDTFKDAGDTVRSVTQPLAQLPGIAAQGENYLLQQGVKGVGGIISNPQMLTQVGAGIATGGLSTVASGVTGGLGGFGLPDSLSSLLTNFLKPSAGPTTSVSVTPSQGAGATADGGYAAPGQKSYLWWIVGGGVALVLVLVVVMMKGRK